MRANSLGDAVRVLGALEPDVRERALTMLGLEVVTPVPVPRKPREHKKSDTSLRTQNWPPPLDQEPVTRPRGLRNDALVEDERQGTGSVPAWFDSVEELPAEPAHDPRHRPIQPLLRPGWQRAVLAAALSDTVPSKEPDVDATVELLARRAPLDRVPRIVRRSLRSGAMLILDVGESMEPFFEDQQQLVAAASMLLAPERIRLVLVRSDAPPPEDAARRRFAGEMPILIVSNFGIVTRGPVLAGAVSGWRRFALALRRRGRRPIALAPLDPASVPLSLRRILPVVSWDRPTGAAPLLRARAAVSAAV